MKNKGHCTLPLIKIFSAKSTRALFRIKPPNRGNSNETAELKHLNEHLQKQMVELQEGSVKDIVKKIRERHIENEIVSTLRTEALQQYS